MAKSKGKKSKTIVEHEQERQDVDKRGRLVDMKIKTIGENPDKKTAPIIGYFSSGYDPLKNDNDIDAHSSVKVYKSLNARNPKNLECSWWGGWGANGSNVNFVGTSYSGEAATPQLCNYALGVFDKETRVLKMVPIAANSVGGLEPKIGASKQPEKESQEEVITAGERIDKLRNLTVMYSTKKNIRRDIKFDTLRQTEDPGNQQGLDNKLKEIKINSEAFEAIVSTTNACNIPPYDLAATAPDMAYPLFKIILKREWDYLFDVFELAQAGSEVNPDV